MITVVAADDHRIVLEGIAFVLRAERDIRLVARCVDGHEALAAVRRLGPDVLLLDLRMPGQDGLRVLSELRREKSSCRVVVLTASLGEGEALDAVRLGARAVLLKQDAPHVLVRCVREVAGGRRWAGNRPLPATVPAGGTERAAAVLSPREVEVARLVAEGRRNREIAQTLAITEGTVKVHLHHAYERLGLSNRVELALWLQGREPASGDEATRGEA
jgi:DNA-binding NarL/FixJ family response regulator